MIMINMLFWKRLNPFWCQLA